MMIVKQNQRKIILKFVVEADCSSQWYLMMRFEREMDTISYVTPRSSQVCCWLWRTIILSADCWKLFHLGKPPKNALFRQNLS